MADKFYITTAISYPNGPPHMGHAYEAIAADVIARFKRLDGHDVYFATGTDDHGQKIYRSARDQGVSPQDMTNRLSRHFMSMCDHFSISYDRFIRTSEPEHHRAVQHIWKKIAEQGDIYKDIYTGWYAVREEKFYTESELIKDDQNQWMTPSGMPVEWVEEESFFFRLSAWQERLLAYYEAHPKFIQPETRRNEVIAFVRGGLLDLSISRSTFDWGVPALENGHENGHIVYVWLDALTNYLTSIGYPDADKEKFEKFWPANLHIIGKDILRFHAVYWPAFLMSAGLPVPERVFAHGMILTGQGEKMSKSLGNVIDPFALSKIYGVDPFRYFLLRDIPFGSDGLCGEKQIIHRLNADLANDLGNLAQRSLTMIQKDWSGKIPPEGAQSEQARALLQSAANMLDDARKAIDDQRLDRALVKIFALISAANRYFANAAPWALAKTDRAAQGAVLNVIVEILRQTAILLQPFMPNNMLKLLDYLNVDADQRDFAALSSRLKPGTMLPPPAPLFPRYKQKE